MGKKKKRLQSAQPVPKTGQPEKTKKVLSRSSIGAIIWGIIFPSVVLVYPMTWKIKVLLMIIIVIGIIIIIERSEWTINRTRPKKMGLIIAAILILIIASYFPIRDQYIKDQPITISPTKFTSYAGIFENRTLFDVHNRSNETIYTTWVKILAEKPIFENFQTTLTTDDGRRFVNPEGGELFNPEILMLHVVDKDKQPVVFLVFRSLSPEETWRFRFYVQSGSNVPRNQRMTFSLSVIDYKDEPYRYGVQGDSAYFQFKLPEGFSFPKKDIFFKMLEKNPPKKSIAKILPEKKEPIKPSENKKTKISEELIEPLRPENIMSTIEKWSTLCTEVRCEKINDPEFDFLLNVKMRSGDTVGVGKLKKYPQYINFLGVIQIPEKYQKTLINLPPARREKVIRNLEIEVDRLQPDGQIWTKPYILIFERRLPITNDFTEDIFLKMLGRIDNEMGLLKKIFLRDLKQELTLGKNEKS